MGLGSNRVSLTASIGRHRASKKVNNQSNGAKYKDQMRRKTSEYKLTILGLVSQLYQKEDELSRVGLIDFNVIEIFST